jgi:RNA polymerase sigma factor (sigma-70 family)
MAHGQLRTFLRHLRGLVHPEGPGGPTDAQLLDRWVGQRDEAAFELLLWRHGPMVLGVCQRLLHQSQDVEDAFQATFLTLVRKAGAIQRREAVGSWLYKVAYRIALRARSGAGKRADHERIGIGEADVTAPAVAGWDDLRDVLDEEVHRLPECYRVPFVLCYLEGWTNEEAARRLGCPPGTILSRLSRARQRLRDRLTRRGLALSGAVLTTVLTENALSATVPAKMVESTIQAAIHFTAGTAATASALSPRAAALTEGVLRTMLLTKVKMVGALFLTASLLGVGTGALTYRTLAAGAPAPEDTREPAETMRVVSPYVRVPSQRDGVLVLVGTEIKKDETVPPELLVTLTSGGETTNYRRLRAGDKVEKGQLLGRIDDRLARDELASRKTKLTAAEADQQASLKTRDEAEQRYITLRELNRKQPGTVSTEDVRGGKLTWDRYLFEEIAKKAAVDAAKVDIRQAQTLVDMHEIRSPVRGILRTVNFHQGEAVKNLETVFVIRITEGRD